MADLKAPFPWFGGKSRAVAQVWDAFGEVRNYVEPFAGSAAMLLGAPEGRRVETINDFDGFVSNFWRAVSMDPDAVAQWADWPVNEADLFARHSWLIRQGDALRTKLEDPEFFDAKIAGWWCWGACSWIGSGWCSGTGPWVWDGERITKGDSGQGINRQLPRLGNSGRGAFIRDWFDALRNRMRDTRVTCGDWSRVCKDSVTIRHGLTGVFLDPPYTKGAMDYAVGGCGGRIADDVRAWCKVNGGRNGLRIVLCGHAGEHDELLAHGWHLRTWIARKGYAVTEEAVANSASETLWCSPHCVNRDPQNDLIGGASG